VSHLLETKALASDTNTLVIPVVVHVLWNSAAENISDAQIYSQIDVLNEDFRRQNADTTNTPAMFSPLGADCNIEFCLAKRTPDTLNTTGIERKYTTVAAFPMDNTMKSDFTGGLDAWDADHYLNLWVCNMAGNILGYAQYPGGEDSTDGIVIHYRNFGRIGNLDPHYNEGRTATHEIGHWLDLYHIWGDDFGSCDGSDEVDDTPNARDANYYCPTHPRITVCNSTGEMFMNYMDYSDDDCLNIYTQGQKERMWAAINTARPLLKYSKGCNPVIGITENNRPSPLQVYPNPGKGLFNILTVSLTESLQIDIVDIMGAVVYHDQVESGEGDTKQIDLSGKPAGIYFLHARGKLLSYYARLVLVP
jgi:hypothetical protein